MFGRKPKKAELIEPPEEIELPEPPEIEQYTPAEIPPVPKPKPKPIQQPQKADDEEYWQKMLEDIWLKVDYLFKKDVERFR